MKNKFTLLSLLIAVGLIGNVSADVGTCSMMGGTWSGMMGGYGSGMMVFSWVTSLLVIGLIVAAIYWLIKSANKKSRR